MKSKGIPTFIDDTQSFLEAIQDTVQLAQDSGQVYYLYRGPGLNGFNWGASTTYWKDWVFRAWPGGRKEFSVRGREILIEYDLIEYVR